MCRFVDMRKLLFAVVCSKCVLGWRGYECCSGALQEEAVVAVVWRRLFMLLRCCEIRKLLLQLCGAVIYAVALL